MDLHQADVLAFPKISAVVRDNGTAEVVVAGNSRTVPAAAGLQQLRDNALTIVVREAQALKRPVRVHVDDPEGHGELIVRPDSSTESVSYTAKTVRRRAEASATTAAPAMPPAFESGPVKPGPPAANTDGPEPSSKARATVHVPTGTLMPLTPETTSAPAPAGEDPTRRSLKETSFLVSAPVLEPATKGWRGTLTRLGVRMDPSKEETAEREDVRTVSQHWPGPRTVAVVNRKGGANKTPTVVMLSAILARYSGAATCAWDNNESQGTLGWRTEKGAHDRSVLDLIDSSQALLSPSTNAAEIAKFVHHQTADKFDVLRSDENEEGDHEVTAEEVDIAHQVLTRYYRLVIMDSGNTARAANWRRMIDHTDQLVVPVTAIEDRAEAARLTLQTLESRGGHDAELARNAVVIVSESTDAKRSMSGDALKRAKDEAQRIADGFAPYVRAVVRIPYDPALVNGPIRYETLQPATQRAWLAAAAAVANGF